MAKPPRNDSDSDSEPDRAAPGEVRQDSQGGSRLIYGFHAVLGKLRRDPEGVFELYLAAQRQDIRAREVQKIAESQRVRLIQDIDVGGGSTELSVFCNGEMVASRSFNLGGIRILDNQDKDETWSEMKDWVKQNTQPYKNLSGIGTGGNINKLFRMADLKDGSPLTFAKLRSLYLYLYSFSLKDRINVLGLNQDRADVIIPASEIYLSVMKWGGVKQIYVPRVGLVDGIMQMLIDKNFSE